MDQQKKWRWKLVFWCYCILMLWLLFGQRVGNMRQAPYLEQVKGSMNLEPLRTIRNYVSVAQWTQNSALLRHIVVNLAGNVVMFIPLGFLLPQNWCRFRSFWRLFFRCFLMIAGIELIQLVTLLGSLDVDDVILNLIGSVIGYWIWLCIRK